MHIDEFMLYSGVAVGGLLILVIIAIFKSLHSVKVGLAKLNQINQKLLQVTNELKRANKSLTKLANDAGSTETEEDNLCDAKLYVGNVDYAVSEDELEDMFARFGDIEMVNIPVDRHSGRARGFGFVTFASPEQAERAIELNGSELRGRQIQVNYAKERS